MHFLFHVLSLILYAIALMLFPLYKKSYITSCFLYRIQKKIKEISTIFKYSIKKILFQIKRIIVYLALTLKVVSVIVFFSL